MTTTETCSNCGTPIRWDHDRCPRCRSSIAPPNVRAANQPQERKALGMRYKSALAESAKRGVANIVTEFETLVRTKSHAVVNVWPEFVNEFLLKKAIYRSYHPLVDQRIRRPASINDDRRRRTVDAHLFGSVAQHIITGALSLDECGLQSYGGVALCLADQTCQAAASLLESNSYDFYAKHHIQVSATRIPSGYICSWPDRQILAVAKIARDIQPDTTQSDFIGLVLKSGNNRGTDEFIEVHIYGPLEPESVEVITIQKPNQHSRIQRQLLKIIREKTQKSGVKWVQDD